MLPGVKIVIDLVVKRIDNRNRIVIPMEWLNDLENQKILMCIEKYEKSAIVIPEEMFDNLNIKPLIAYFPTIGKKGYLTIKKEFRKLLDIKENDFLQLVYNKELKIIIIYKPKINKFKRKFASFLPHPIIKNKSSKK